MFSVVIPVRQLNPHFGDCLDSVSSQGSLISEIIIVLDRPHQRLVSYLEQYLSNTPLLTRSNFRLVESPGVGAGFAPRLWSQA